MADNTSDASHTLSAQEPIPAPASEPHLCLWFSELHPGENCNLVFDSKETLFKHVIDEHVLVNDLVPVFTCMWFNRTKSRYCRRQIGDAGREEGAALEDMRRHVWAHFWEEFEGMSGCRLL